MTESETQCLKDSVDRLVEIETFDGEKLVAKILFAENSNEYNEHNLLYELISTNTPEFYARFENSGGFVMDFGKILTVKPNLELEARS
jgi:hypothetical protein